MKRPLLVIALLYVSGLLAAVVVPFELRSLLCCSLVLCVVAIAFGKARPYLVGPLVILAGAANLTVNEAVISPYDLRVVLGERTEFVTVRGRLAQTPQHRVYEFDEPDESWRTVGQLDVESVRRPEADWEPAVGRLAYSVPGVLPPDYFEGQKVEVTGVIARPKVAPVEGVFDYRRYLNRLGIHYQLRVKSTNDWQLVRRPPNRGGPPLGDRFVAWAKQTLAGGLPEQDEPLRLLWAMTLGWRTALTDEVALPFMRSGTMHIFAISGLHVALIAGMLITVLRVAQLPRSVCGVIVIPLLWFYTAATGWQASAIRATIMTSVLVASWALNRPTDLLNSLAAAALLVLVWEPRQLFQASFQLSFAVVLSLALVTPRFQKLWQRWLQPDPFLPEELWPPWQRWLCRPAHWFAAALATSAAAWLGSAPLIAHYFNLVTPVTLLANVVVVPLAGLALAGTMASLLTAWWFPGAATLFSHSAWFWMMLTSEASRWAARAPFGHFYVSSPPLAAFLFYYGALLTVLTGWLRKQHMRVWLVTALAVLCALNAVQWLHRRTAPRLTVVPLSGGYAVYCQPAWRGKDMLIDCGSESAAEFVLVPFLRARGVDKLGTLVLTHGHLNQIGGAKLVVEEFKPGQIATNTAKFRSPVYRRIIAQLAASGGCWLGLNRSDRLGPWTVLHPAPADRFNQADDTALVLHGTIRGTRVLLLSDLSQAGQQLLLEREPDLAADIIVTGLPTDGQPVAESLLRVVKPKLVIVADSEYPATRRANTKLRQRLGGRPFQVLYTSQIGSVRLTFGKNNWELHTALPPAVGRASLKPKASGSSWRQLSPRAAQSVCSVASSYSLGGRTVVRVRHTSRQGGCPPNRV